MKRWKKHLGGRKLTFSQKTIHKSKIWFRTPEGNNIFGANGGNFYTWRYMMGINNTHHIVLDKYFWGKHCFFCSILPHFLPHDTHTYLLLLSYVPFESIKKRAMNTQQFVHFCLRLFDEFGDSVGFESDPGSVIHPSFIVLSLFLYEIFNLL